MKKFVLFFLLLSVYAWAGNVSVNGRLEILSNEVDLIVKNTGEESVHFTRIVFYYGGRFITNEVEGNLIAGEQGVFRLMLPSFSPQGSYPVAALFVYENDRKPVSLIVTDYVHHGKPSILKINPTIHSSVIHRSGKIVLSLKDSLNYDVLFPAELSIEKVITNRDRIVYWVRNRSYPLKNHTRAAFLFYKKSAEGISAYVKTIPIVLQASARSPLSAIIFWAATLLLVLIIFSLLFIPGLKAHQQGKQEFAWKQIFLATVFLIGFFTYFWQYDFPSTAFWDENYHIASAQKYIKGVFFMEPHPPLGKLLIAFGEVIFHPNRGLDTSGFLKTDHINRFPAGYSFAGMRFFPSLLAWLSAVLFYLILVRILKKPRYAFLFTSLYLFENGLIGHSRSAMLEGIQLFFIFAVILYFIRLWQAKREKSVKEYFVLSLWVGLASAVKLNGLILTLLFVFLAFSDYWKKIVPAKIKDFRLEKMKFGLEDLKTLGLKTLLSLIGVFFVIGISYYVHIARCTRIESGRVYQASSEYRKILKRGNPANPLLFPKLLKEHIDFISHYEKGVPKWDPTKVGENGSPAFAWPFGYKSINYCWSKVGGRVLYKYLIGNPYIWTLSLISLLLTFIILGHLLIFDVSEEFKNRKSLFELLFVFFTMYVAYMWVMLRMERVMYLYHYFVPLIFTFILIPIVFRYLFEPLIENNDKVLWWTTLAFVIQIFVVYLYFSPFTYFFPLSTQDFMRRVWSHIWDLKPVL